MKRIKYIFHLLLWCVVVVLTGCNKELQVDPVVSDDLLVAAQLSNIGIVSENAKNATKAAGDITEDPLTGYTGIVKTSFVENDLLQFTYTNATIDAAGGKRLYAVARYEKNGEGGLNWVVYEVLKNADGTPALAANGFAQINDTKPLTVYLNQNGSSLFYAEYICQEDLLPSSMVYPAGAFADQLACDGKITAGVIDLAFLHTRAIIETELAFQTPNADVRLNLSCSTGSAIAVKCAAEQIGGVVRHRAIVPASETDKTWTLDDISISYNSERYSSAIKTDDGNPVQIESGKSHFITLLIGANGLKIISFSVARWSDGAPQIESNDYDFRIATARDLVDLSYFIENYPDSKVGISGRTYRNAHVIQIAGINLNELTEDMDYIAGGVILDANGNITGVNPQVDRYNQYAQYYRPAMISAIFGGVYNGNGHTLSNFGYPIFYSVKGGDSPAILTNIHVVNSSIGFRKRVSNGTLANDVSNTLISYCSVQLKDKSDLFVEVFGGLVGSMDATSYMTRCSFAGEFNFDRNYISTASYIGGLVGDNAGVIAGCIAKGSFDMSSLYGVNAMGGLVGYNRDTGEIFASAYTGKIKTLKVEYGAGGVVGKNEGMIGSCYSTEAVEIQSGVANSFVGDNSGTILSTNCVLIGLGQPTGFGAVKEVSQSDLYSTLTAGNVASVKDIITTLKRTLTVYPFTTVCELTSAKQWTPTNIWREIPGGRPVPEFEYEGN